jgi:hypothetical protein
VIVLLGVPLALQALAMLFDEVYFHRRRGLPLWERVGHPLDTSSVLACFAVALFAPWTTRWLAVYVALSVFSCLFITKDEAIHAERCSAGEHWLHSVLFVLHPIVLAATALLWMRGLRALLLAQTGLTLGFGAYQLVYWNLTWRPSWTRRQTSAR